MPLAVNRRRNIVVEIVLQTVSVDVVAANPARVSHHYIFIDVFAKCYVILLLVAVAQFRFIIKNTATSTTD